MRRCHITFALPCQWEPRGVKIALDMCRIGSVRRLGCWNMIDAKRVLGPGSSCAEAFDIVVAACMEDLDLHLAQFMHDPAPDGPHKARVALRRLTTALDAFRSVLKRKRTAKIRRDAKAIFRLLGEVRDADVYLARQEGRPDKAETLECLSRDVEALRHRVRGVLRKDNAADFARNVMEQVEGGKLFRDGPAGRAAKVANVRSLASMALDMAAEACSGHGDDVALMRADDRHEFRKDLKSLRYLVEFFEPLWPDVAPGVILDQMQALQGELGSLNDIANLRKREGGSDAHADEEAEALSRANAVWQRLRGAKPWWSPPGEPPRRKGRPARD